MTHRPSTLGLAKVEAGTAQVQADLRARLMQTSPRLKPARPGRHTPRPVVQRRPRRARPRQAQRADPGKHNAPTPAMTTADARHLLAPLQRRAP